MNLVELITEDTYNCQYGAVSEISLELNRAVNQEQILLDVGLTILEQELNISVHELKEAFPENFI